MEHAVVVMSQIADLAIAGSQFKALLVEEFHYEDHYGAVWYHN